MPRVAWRKAWSDARANKTQTILFVVVVAIAAAMVTLAAAAQRAAGDPWKRTFEASKGYHITFFAQDREELPQVQGIGGVVDQVGPYRHAYFIGSRLDGRPLDLSLAERPSAMPATGHPLVTEGRWLSAGGTNEIVFDRNLARDLDIGVGQTLSLTLGSDTARFRVVGLAFNP